MPHTPLGRRWTLTELAELRRLARRLPVTQLALLLGRTVAAVRTKAAHERIRLVDRPARSDAADRFRPWDAEP